MCKITRAVRLMCLLTACSILLFCFSGCSDEPSLVRYDLSDWVESLDPQFADEESEQLVIYNMMEGLMRQLPSGKLENGVIEGYEVSDDQTEYTFRL